MTKSVAKTEIAANRRDSQEGFLGGFATATFAAATCVASGGEKGLVPLKLGSLSSGKRHRGYGRDNGGGLRRTKAGRMLRPHPRSDS